MKLNLKNNYAAYKKSIYIKKFFLIYLLKTSKENFSFLDHKKKNFSNFHQKAIEKKYEIIKHKQNTYFGKDFFKFYFFFQLLVGFFSETKKIKGFSLKFLPKIQNKKLNKQFNYKKKKYFVKNFRKSKEKQYLWFHEARNNSFFRKPQKNQKAHYIFNTKILLNVISTELFKQSIIGFSKKSIEFIHGILKKRVQLILVELGEISNKRRMSTKKIFDNWGKNNLIKKKIKNHYKFHFEFKFKSKIKISIRKFKVKKKLFENFEKKNKNNITIKDFNVIKNDKKKLTETEDILFRANKTLMALLDEILRNRIEELQKATSCLCLYKPSENNFFLPKKEDLEKKEKNKIISTNNKLITAQSKLLNSFWYLTGIDCFLFLKETVNFDNQHLCLSLLIILMSDFNLQFQFRYL